MYRNKNDRKNIEQALGYQFKEEKLLQQALTRRSALNEGRQELSIGDFQRLEFIGDKVLNLIISDIIFENNPNWDEGKLTTEVSKFVNNKGPLANIAKRLKLGEYLLMGVGEEKENNGRENQKILSDAFEALIGALWIDSGKDFSFMRDFLLKQYAALGLTDFNQDYERAVITAGIRNMADDIMASVMPEIYEAEGGPGDMSLQQMFNYKIIKSKATKPLTGLAACFAYFSENSREDKISENKTEINRLKTDHSTVNKDAMTNIETSVNNTLLALAKEPKVLTFHELTTGKKSLSPYASLAKNALAGDSDAKYELANSFFAGESYQLAFSLFYSAAQAGHAEAQCSLGMCYEEGHGVEQDQVAAVYWYLKAAQQGVAFAQYNLSIACSEGKGIKQDAHDAFTWCHKAAEQNEARAQLQLSYYYHQGKGVVKNMLLAFEWCQRAAIQDHPEAQYNLGIHYYNGDGVAKEMGTAILWLKRASDNEYPPAQAMLKKLVNIIHPATLFFLPAIKTKKPIASSDIHPAYLTPHFTSSS